MPKGESPWRCRQHPCIAGVHMNICLHWLTIFTFLSYKKPKRGTFKPSNRQESHLVINVSQFPTVERNNVSLLLASLQNRPC